MDKPMGHQKRLLIGLSLLLIAGYCTNSFSTVYQWVDTDGQVNFSDQPGSSNARRVEIMPPPAEKLNQPNLRAQDNHSLQQNPENKQVEQRSSVDNTQAAKPQVDLACKQYRENLALLENEGKDLRLYTIKSNGEYHYLSDTERQQRILATQNLIKKYCS